MDTGTQLIVITLAVGALVMVLTLFLAVMGPEIRRWFRVMARRDLPVWDNQLRHLETHDFDWNGTCGTCRADGRRYAERSYSLRERTRIRESENKSRMWGKGYEAGYADGQTNRPRREG